MLSVLSSKAVTRVAQFLTFILLARTLSPENFGWFGMITTAMALGAMMGSLGLRQSISRELGQGAIEQPQAVGLALLLPLPLGLATGLIVSQWVLRQESIDRPDLVAIYAGVGVAGAISLLMAQGVFLGNGEINRFSATEALPRVALLLIVVGLTHFGTLTLSLAVGAHAVGFLGVAVFVALYSLMRNKVRITSPRHLMAMIRFGAVFAVNLTLITLAPRISMFVLEHFYGPGASAQFFGAVRIAEIFLEVSAAMAMVLFSDGVRAKETMSRLPRNTGIACWLFWIFLPIGGVVALTAPWFVPLLLGDAYQGAVPALRVVALGLGAAAGSRIIYISLAAAGKPQFGTPLLILSLSVNFSTALLWIPTFGVTGGAWSLVLSQFVLYFCYILLCRFKGYATWSELLVPSMSSLRAG
ncbi:oligosaccharide flippase family protein [Nesterenkonia jeotgali]|uniref:oligosaccharide flippase family protein n=1 Tax=Nesterenkonia jeotgali TaxID=317018 RepID=UPI0009F82214|nr:oligosaccharide flippase family protein [Nesterenkonia jeotgali]